MPVLTLVRIDGQVPWKCFRGNGGNWVAVCDPLKLTVQSDTWGDLMEDIGLTLDALLRDLLASQELPNFLRDHGWTLAGPMPTRPEDVRFELPFLTAMTEPHGPTRHIHQ
jgi:hypothetical protein